MFINTVANQIEADNAIADNADIWSKGNAGEELTPAEFAIFSGQVRNITDIAYYEIQVSLQMGLDEAAIFGKCSCISPTTRFSVA